MTVRAKLQEKGLELPAALKRPGGGAYPFVWVRRLGDRAFVSGHLPLHPDGSLAEPFGKVGAEVSLEAAVGSARKVALAMLGSLERELGDLERITGWGRVLGLVNAAPGFTQVPLVLNGFSELILELFGPARGAHARAAVGVAELPFGVPVEIEAEVEVGAG
jgi:enamine deaminase RidA (YjgF/YER057c/UK114 family)